LALRARNKLGDTRNDDRGARAGFPKGERPNCADVL
jgi:hypothetical protein